MSKRPAKSKQVINQGTAKIDNYIVYTLLMVIGIIPLLVRGKTIKIISPKIGEAIINSGVQVDFFTYYKWIILITLSLVAITLFIYKMEFFNYQIPESYINIPILLLVVLALSATVNSEYKYIALIGVFNRHEGLITFLCCLMLFFIASNTKLQTRQLKWVTWSLGLLTIINASMGLANFYGYKLIVNPIISFLVLPHSLKQVTTGYIMATLNNPNYVAGFGGVLTIFFVSITVFSKDIKLRLISGCLALISFTMTLVGLSLGGFLALICIAPVIIILGLIKRGWSSLIPVLVISLMCSGLFTVLNNHNSQVKKETIGGVKDLIRESSLLTPAIAAAAPIPTFKPTISQEHFRLPEAGITSGAGRGYIWAKTITMIKDKPLLGYGFDTFMYKFPQNDRDKVSGMGTYEITVDKPHNMFLGMAYNAGVPFLLSFVVLIGIFLYNSAKTIKLRHNSGETTELVGWSLAITLFVITFLIQGLFNDSIIATTPIFWVLLGLGVGLQRELLAS